MLETKEKPEAAGEAKPENKAEEAGGRDRDKLAINPAMDEYGDRLAEIIDFAILDNTGKVTNTVLKGEKFTIKIKIKAHTPIDNPIVAMTVKNLKGMDITGTNTLFEGINVGHLEEGDERTVSFLQSADMQGGQYLVSLGCTRYEGDELKVYHRLYDVVSLGVVSVKDTVGFYDTHSEITVE